MEWFCVTFVGHMSVIILLYLSLLIRLQHSLCVNQFALIKAISFNIYNVIYICCCPFLRPLQTGGQSAIIGLLWYKKNTSAVTNLRVIRGD